MRRLTAILFLSVFGFNLAGYQLVIGYLQQQQDTRLVAQLDQMEYSHEQLISIKTPLTLPYYSNSEAYERVDGTIEMEGIEYRYVKRRVFNDSLELLCIPNWGKEQLQSAKLEFFKLSNDWTSSQGGKKSTATWKQVLPEFCEEISFYSCTPVAAIRQSFGMLPAPALPSLCIRVQEQPPDSMQWT